MTDTITVIFANSGLIPNGLTLGVEARTETSRTAVISLHLNGTLVSDRQIKSEAYAKYNATLPDYILTTSENSTNLLVVSLSVVSHPAPFPPTLLLFRSLWDTRAQLLGTKIPMRLSTRDMHLKFLGPYMLAPWPPRNAMSFWLDGVTNGSHILEHHFWLRHSHAYT